MLIGRKFFEYEQANRRIHEIEQKEVEYMIQKEKYLNEQEIEKSNIAQLQAQPINDDIRIELALCKQRIFLLQKDLDRLEEKWREESLIFMQEKYDLEQKINEFKTIIPNQHWKIYQRIKETKENPVVEVKHQMCTGCFMPLSQTNLNQWRRGKDLVLCEVCDRILA
ncbi:C4-type zinc ribbon domain-containing protein [Tepidibacillus decaturensis]|uniref:C4-type zinc ribbon domain-containing protein n=1 Tax=Tepidibacillus decaturensis TaxID=1413211 RepID=A0A135L2F9_9BACI|nr:C4-type zinc ribbon domain-containing protein [Tepidibacillus decaturensis]KXG43198.1 hypothetical protein U473_03575 [Tepidibacillus decaturensis]